jgi:hypothetical protein
MAATVAESDDAGSGGGCGCGERMKLLFSLGGRILPRPGDDTLWYAGGDIRIMFVPRGVSLQDLLVRLADTYDASHCPPPALHRWLGAESSHEHRGTPASDGPPGTRPPMTYVLPPCPKGYAALAPTVAEGDLCPWCASQTLTGHRRRSPPARSTAQHEQTVSRHALVRSRR